MSDAFQKVEDLGNKVNSAVYKYLRAPEREDRDFAYDELVGCCWVACLTLYAPADGSKTSRTDRTRAFIEKELHTILAGYKQVAADEIDQLALNKKLRWVARQVRNKLIDAVRRFTAERKRQERKAAALLQAPITPAAARRLATGFKADSPRLVQILGRRNFETLLILASSYPFGETKRARKSAMVRAIARSRGVSLQQARSDRRHLLSAIENANDYVLAERVEQILGKGFLQTR